MDPQQPQQDEPKPIAYDPDGQPLYAAPPTTKSHDNESSRRQFSDAKSHVTNVPEYHEGHNFDPRMRAQYGNEPRVVHTRREYEPQMREISDELRQRCDESHEKYPDLNLSEGEYIILNIRRHPIGLWVPVSLTVGTIILLLAALVSYPLVADSTLQTSFMPEFGTLAIFVFMMMILVGIFGYVAVWVYVRNTFYLTNESVIQEIQHGVFSKHEQTVSLGSIEDASYRQYGLWQALFNYGTIRLSTEGEETTYRFQYVANPKTQIARINNAIEAFKNGRPVGDD